MIYEGKSNKLVLGNLDIVRDWGWADEYVRAMHSVLSAEEPKDYIISTGSSYSLSEFVEKTFNYLNLRIEDHLLLIINLLGLVILKNQS